MKRPYIFCHMMTSIDGKITGSFLETPEVDVTGTVYYDIVSKGNPYYDYQGWLVGRVTAAGDFSVPEELILDEDAALVPEGDFVQGTDTKMYYAVVDPSGKLAWESNEITYINTRAHIIEILTERTSNAYKAFLRNLGISYIIAGKDSLNYEMALEKLKKLFGIKTLMLGGGAVLNWSLIQAGMCDEVSIVIAPVADGASEVPSVFEARKGLSESRAVGFQLQNAEIKQGGSVWLRYILKNNVGKEGESQ